jgi:4-hydroxybenzoate polyprenyltransferase
MIYAKEIKKVYLFLGRLNRVKAGQSFGQGSPASIFRFFFRFFKMAFALTETRKIGILEPYVRLIRPPNLITAAADILAGYAVTGLAISSHLAFLVIGSMLLYAGGVVLNDYFDRKLDALERPERPIPSGRVRPVNAAILGLFLLAAGIGVSWISSIHGGVIAAAIAGCIVFYNAIAKHYIILGPIFMGTCRGLNLLLGLSAASAVLEGKWAIALLPLVYIAAITMISAGEVKGGKRSIIWVATALVISVLGGIALLCFDPNFKWGWALPVVAFLCYRIMPPIWRACRKPAAMNVRAAVKSGVLSLIVLDAALAAGYAGPLYGVAVLALLIIAAALAHIFAVT